MVRKRTGLLLLAGFIALCGGLFAEPVKTITIKIYDGKSGRPVMPTGYQVRVDHNTEMHGDWVKQHEDGTAELTVPADAAVVALHFAYEMSMEIYINCDADKNAFGDVWYSVPQIMAKGLVTSNLCGKTKPNEKYKTTAAPGELILFVRERNWRDRQQN
jgi:hypothetical protein